MPLPVLRMIKAMLHLELVPGRSHGSGLLLHVCRGRRGRIEEVVPSESVGGVRVMVVVALSGKSKAAVAILGCYLVVT